MICSPMFRNPIETNPLLKNVHFNIFIRLVEKYVSSKKVVLNPQKKNELFVFE